MEYPKELVKKVYRSLPDELMQIIATPETLAINEDITKTYLGPNQGKGLGDEVTTRLLGLIPEEDFPSRLQDRLKIPESVAVEISDAIKARIFSKIPQTVMLNQEVNAKRIMSEAEQPIVITQETKVEALKELDRRDVVSVKHETIGEEINSYTNLPQMIHNSLPMIEEGEVVHDVPHVEAKAPEVEAKTPQPPIPPVTQSAPAALKLAQEPAPEPKKAVSPAPSNRYPEGFDPYREPIV